MRWGGGVGTHTTYAFYSDFYIWHGWGSIIPGLAFSPGSYNVELYYDGVLIANGEFDVY